MKRRDLLKAAVLGTLARPDLVAAQVGPSEPPPKAPASDRIQVGVIGVGGFGCGANLPEFLRQPDVDVVAVCDAYEPHLARGVERAGGTAARHVDYRRILEDPAIDAVVITTPEHWHAVMCIDACDAGKDVYVEKPCAHHVRDGRLMVDAARRHSRIVQVGTQQRSGAHFQRAVRYVQEGRIGEVYYATCWHHSPPRPAPSPVSGGPPAGMHWDLWLGPAPSLPYDEVWSVGRRGYWDFWGGLLTEWGSHLADVVLWAMKAEAPRRVVAVGGQYHHKHGEIPDTLQVSATYPGFLFHYSILHHNTYGLNGELGAARFGSYGIQFHGTKGTLFVDRGGFRLTPQPTRREEPDQPPPPTTTDSRAPGFYYTTGITPEVSDSSVQHPPHVRNFLDCVKSRQRPSADIESAHHTNTLLRLGNIAYRVGRALEWDATEERIIGDAEANELAIGTYRDPWRPKGLVP